MSSSVTAEVVNFLLKTDFPPDDVIRKAVNHVTDGIGVMLAGSRAQCVKKLVDFILEKGSRNSCTLMGFEVGASPPDTALVNGTSGHADDYDDTQLSASPDRISGMLTHPTVPVLAAALAVGESVSCSGKEFIGAFVAGFEVECKLAEAIKPEHYKRGFHTTGTIGAFGATAASARLLRLNEDEIRHALGITASMSSGIRANFGTMTKPLHAGMAASKGVIACTLAKRGFTADRNSLDGRWGFMEVFGCGADPEKILGKLGRRYSLLDPGASIKIYPCGSLAHPSMDALLEILIEENLRATDVREIRLRAGPNILDPLRYTQPANELQAKFSLHFGLATILLKHRAGLREYTTHALNDPEIQEAMKKIRLIPDSEIAGMGTDKIRSIVEVQTKSGRTISRVAEVARGTPQKPLRDLELYEKFKKCASFALDESKIDQVLKIVRAIEGLTDIRKLTSRLAPKLREPN